MVKVKNILIFKASKFSKATKTKSKATKIRNHKFPAKNKVPTKAKTQHQPL